MELQKKKLKETMQHPPITITARTGPLTPTPPPPRSTSTLCPSTKNLKPLMKAKLPVPLLRFVKAVVSAEAVKDDVEAADKAAVNVAFVVELYPPLFYHRPSDL